MSIKTMGGEWSTNTYEEVKSGGKSIGVDIDLKFMPEAPVDAKKIGLTQMVTSKDEGSVVALNETVKKRSIASGESGEGAHIDQLKQFENPMYATDKTDDDDEKLADTKTHDSWGQHGWHYKNGDGNIEKQEALLKDTPKLPGRGKNASQIFETAAVCIEGAQEGTYYGSVEWGWKTDGEGKFEMLPLTVVSQGVPSATFMKAAELWNKGKTSKDEDTMDLPTAFSMGYKCYTDDGLKARIEELEEDTKSNKDPNLKFELLYLKQEAERRKAATDKE